jgi:effector-binding domain-containing protein
MSHSRRAFAGILGAVLIFMSLAFGAPNENEETPEIKVKVKKYKKQVVLYTVHRGNYRSIGTKVRDLYYLAEEKGIRILGTPSYVYYNRPQDVSPKHLLIEARLEAAPESLEHSGKLGEWIDVKEVPGYTAATAIKEQGVADPAPIYDELLEWIIENGYIPVGAPVENFLIGSTNSKYEKVKSEITMPIIKPEGKKKEEK